LFFFCSSYLSFKNYSKTNWSIIRIKRFSYYVIIYYEIDSLKYRICNPAWYSLTCISLVMYKEHWIVKYTINFYLPKAMLISSMINSSDAKPLKSFSWIEKQCKRSSLVIHFYFRQFIKKFQISNQVWPLQILGTICKKTY
jgi:hypothetical protein